MIFIGHHPFFQNSLQLSFIFLLDKKVGFRSAILISKKTRPMETNVEMIGLFYGLTTNPNQVKELTKIGNSGRHKGTIPQLLPN